MALMIGLSGVADAQQQDELVNAAGPAPIFEAAAQRAAPVSAGAPTAQADGTLGYSIPIKIPPGRGGVEPGISVTINSALPNGLAGNRSAIEGFGAIVRIPYNTGITYTDDDTFAVASTWGVTPSHEDRLVLDPDTTYPAGDVVYRSHLNGRARVIVGSTSTACGGDEICYFVVHDLAGNTLYYGGDALNNASTHGVGWHATVWEGNHGVTVNRGIRAYLLYKVVNVHGQSYQIAYNDADESRYPDEVLYTLPAATYAHKVEFSYESRLDPVAPPFNFSKRLSAIAVKSQNDTSGYELLHQYNFSYETSPSTGRSRLTAIEVENASGTVEPGSTTIVWQDGPAAIDPWATLGDLQYVQLPINQTTSGKTNYETGDFNGDGRDDVVLVRQEADPSGALTTEFNVFEALSGGAGIQPFQQHLADTLPDVTTSVRPLVMDINGDLKQDLILIQADFSFPLIGAVDVDYTVRALLGSPTGLTAPIEIVGRTDADWDETAGHAMAADVNGDQLDDIVLVADQSRMLVRGQANPFHHSAFLEDYGDFAGPPIPGARPLNRDASVTIADLEGDGYLDVVMASSKPKAYSHDCSEEGVLMLQASSGRPGPGSFSRKWQASNVPVGYNGCLNEWGGPQCTLRRLSPVVTDINGDGRDEISFSFNGPNNTYSEHHPTCALQFGQEVHTVFPRSSVSFDELYQNQIASLPTESAAAGYDHAGDINGDGFTDLVHISGNQPWPWASPWATGQGPFLLRVAYGSKQGLLTPGPAIPIADAVIRHGLFDVNGDGMTDVWVTGPDGDKVTISLGSATGPMTPFTYAYGAAYAANPSSRPPSQSWASTLTGDFNGDGKSDLLWIPDGSTYPSNWVADQIRYALSDPTKVDVVKEVHNGYGARWEIDYEPAAAHSLTTDYRAIETEAFACSPNDTQGLDPRCGVPDPRPRHVVTQIRAVDSTNGYPESTTSYHYKNARVLPGPFDLRLTLGYEEIRARTVETGVTQQTQYYQGGLQAGRILRTATWLRFDTATQQLLDRSEERVHFHSLEQLAATGDPERWRLLQSQTQSSVYSAAGVEFSTSEELEYDNWRVRQVNTMEGVTSPRTITRHKYFLPDSYTFDGRLVGVVTEDQTGRLLEMRRYTYDAIAAHLLRQEEEYLFPDLETAYCSFDRAASNPLLTLSCIGRWVAVRNDLQYDQYGSPTFSRDPLGHPAVATYDTNWNTHAVSETNAIGQTLMRALDVHGRIETEESPYRSQLFYDQFGRLEEAHAPDVLDSNSSQGPVDLTLLDPTQIGPVGDPGKHASFQYLNYGDPTLQRVVKTTFRTPTVSHDNTDYFSGFGMVYKNVQTSQLGDITSARTEAYAPDPNHSKTVVLTRPAFVGDATRSTRMTFDLRGRPVLAEQLRPDGTTVERVMASESYGFREKTTLSARQIQDGLPGRVVTYDDVGRVTAIQDPLGETTNYQYFANTDILQRIDLPNGDYEEYRRDGWGRVTEHQSVSAERPSRGTITYQYDDLSRPTQVTDEMGRTSTTTYDAAGRVASVTSGDGLGLYCFVYSTWRLREVFEAPACTAAVADRLWRRQMWYDRRGNVTRLIETRANLPGRSFASSYSYDHDGRILTITYPDGVQANYLRSDTGVLESILVGHFTQPLGWTPYVNYYDFDARRRPGRKVLLDGTETNYDYNHFGQLEELQTVTLSGNVLQHRTLQHNEDGHVESISDLRPLTLYNGVETTIQQSMTYDAAGQMVTATSPTYGPKTYDFDSAGFITSKDGLNYSYSNSPGLFGSFSPQSYTRIVNGAKPSGGNRWTAYYNRVGDRIGWSAEIPGSIDHRYLSMEYDRYHRMTSVTLSQSVDGTYVNQTGTTENKYDESERRIEKREEDVSRNIFTPIHTSYFMDSQYEVRWYAGDPETSETKFIHVGGVPLASVTTHHHAQMPEQSDYVGTEYTSMVGDTLFGPPAGIQLYHTDQRASVEVVTDLGHVQDAVYEPAFRDAEREMVASELIYRGAIVELEKSFEQSDTINSVKSNAAGRYPSNIDLNLESAELAADAQALTAQLATNDADTAYEDAVLELSNQAVAAGYAANARVVVGWGPQVGLYTVERSRYVYGPFGQLLSQNSTGYDVSTKKLGSHERDALTGLTYMRARFYDPISGLFLTPDSMVVKAYGAGYNRYAYVLNSPMTLIDPDGHSPDFQAAMAYVFQYSGIKTPDIDTGKIASRLGFGVIYGVVGAGLEIGATVDTYLLKGGDDYMQREVMDKYWQFATDEGNPYTVAAGALGFLVFTPGPEEVIVGGALAKADEVIKTVDAITDTRPLLAVRADGGTTRLDRAGGTGEIVRVPKRTGKPTRTTKKLPAWDAGVVRTANGGLDFAKSPHLYPVSGRQRNIVKIKYTGSRRKDFAAANAEGRLPGGQGAPDGYRWHHLDDYDPVTNTGTMQLVRKEAHKANHVGGVSQYEKATGKKYK